jgi:hypothetical protein
MGTARWAGADHETPPENIIDDSHFLQMSGVGLWTKIFIRSPGYRVANGMHAWNPRLTIGPRLTMAMASSA